MRNFLVGFSVLLALTATIPSAAAEPAKITRHGLATVVETSHLLMDERVIVSRRPPATLA